MLDLYTEDNQCDARYAHILQQMQFQFEDDLRPGANYELAIVHRGEVYISGMIPRIHGAVAVTGRAGHEIGLTQAKYAAQISVMRALAVLRKSLRSLNRVERILRMTVYVQSATGFTQQSEVADAASDILYAVFAPNGGHTRTAVGVAQLPKNAAVELDMVVAVRA